MEIKIVQDTAREQSSGGRKSWTFTIDGVPTMFWAPTEQAIKRVVDRLMKGRSSEAFGGAGLVSPVGVRAFSRGHEGTGRAKIVTAGEVTTETVQTKSGRSKPREKQPGFLYELDGVAHEDKIVTSVEEAKRLAALHAFKTRGRLGRFDEAEKTFEDQYGKQCKVHVLDLPGSELHGKIVAKDEDGGLWHVGMEPKDGIIKFVEIVPPPPR